MNKAESNPSISYLIQLGMKSYIKKGGKKIQEVLKECGSDKLKVLTMKERTVIELRTGLADGNIYSMPEIAEMMNITRQGVNAFEKKAIRKMKQKTEEEEFLMW